MITRNLQEQAKIEKRKIQLFISKNKYKLISLTYHPILDQIIFLRRCFVWSAIYFKIMTRYTCGFLPRILAIIPATRYTCVFLSRILAFYSQVYDNFLTNAHIYAHKKTHIYALQTSMWYTSIPEKIRQNTPKYPKFIQIYPKLYPGILYT